MVVAKNAIPTQHGAIEGKTQNSPTNYYNLDAIISVGYRVDSKKTTGFRIWATNILKEYIIKGFVVDDEGLKQGKTAAEIVYESADHKKDNGKVSHKEAMEKAYYEYDIFNKSQVIKPDFDKIVKQIEKEN